MKKLTKKQQAIIAGLFPKCEDCRHYKPHGDKMMCFRMDPFIAAKETQRVRESVKTSLNCGTQGLHFSPKTEVAT
jgi:hypothetical protein